MPKLEGWIQQTMKSLHSLTGFKPTTTAVILSVDPYSIACWIIASAHVVTLPYSSNKLQKNKLS